MQPISVLIVGAGRIGAFFDAPDSADVLTHAHAFSAHPGFRLLGFVDADPRQAEAAAGVWGGEPFDFVAEAFRRHNVDVAVVSVPDEGHYCLLRELAELPLRLVFAEKPLATSVPQAAELVELYHLKRIPLAVNYSRRYVPEFIALRERIAAGEFGRFLAGTGYYGKGTLHNGSHMIDLLRFLLGEVSGTTTLAGINDWRDDDPTCSAMVEFSTGGRFFMHGIDCRCYTVFEMDLLFEGRRVRLLDAGFSMETHEVAESPVFAGYRVLAEPKRWHSQLSLAFSMAADHLCRHLGEGEPLLCSGEDGLRALEVCSAISREFK